jgi:hypothetical protein
MPGSQKTWQPRQCGLPLISTRHSKQIPIPHNPDRGSPFTDFLHAAPEIIIAAATVVPGVTVTDVPFTVSTIASGMRNLSRPCR